MVLAEDRKQAMAEFKITYVTLSRYLNGNVSNPALGIKLINFFTSQINIRAEAVISISKRGKYGNKVFSNH